MLKIFMLCQNSFIVWVRDMQSVLSDIKFWHKQDCIIYDPLAVAINFIGTCDISAAFVDMQVFQCFRCVFCGEAFLSSSFPSNCWKWYLCQLCKCPKCGGEGGYLVRHRWPMCLLGCRFESRSQKWKWTFHHTDLRRNWTVAVSQLAG